MSSVNKQGRLLMFGRQILMLTQRDQIMRKSSPIFFKKLPKSSHSSFYLKDMGFKRAHSKVAEHLGYFCNKFCHQDVSKIAKSGHTVLKMFALDS